MSFDWEEFFKKQIEECRELEKRAATAEDRAFGGKLVGDGKSNFARPKLKQTVATKIAVDEITWAKIAVDEITWAQ